MEAPQTHILGLVEYYLPGYKSGGPVRTIANMVNQLSDHFEFWIVTRDALREHQAVIAALAPFAAEIRKAAHRMADGLAAGGKIPWMGNDGCAAESHSN